MVPMAVSASMLAFSRFMSESAALEKVMSFSVWMRREFTSRTRLRSAR